MRHEGSFRREPLRPHGWDSGVHWQSFLHSKAGLERLVHSHAIDHAVQSKATTPHPGECEGCRAVQQRELALPKTVARVMAEQRDRHRNREHQSSGARHQARCEQEATNELAHARRPCEEFGRWKAKRSNDLGEAGGRWQFCEPVPECNRDPDHDPQDREAGVRQCRSRSLSSKKKPLQGPSPLQIHTARSNQGPYRVSASFRQGPGGR
jgi:hypothetical protein